MTPLLEPDRDQIEVFAYVIFRYATSGYFSLRAFPEDEKKTVSDNARPGARQQS